MRIRRAPWLCLLALCLLAASVPNRTRADEAGRPPGVQARLALVSALPKTDAFERLAQFEGGVLYGNGRIKIIDLSGTWEQMGRQYGALLAKDVKTVRALAEKNYLERKLALSRQEIEDFSRRHFGLYPPRYQAFARGVLQTSDLDPMDLAVANSFFEFVLVTPHRQDSGHCAALTVWGDFTVNGKTVVGRNFDFAAFFKELSPYLVITVYNPSDASIPAAGVSYAGQFGSVSTFNSAGLALENNDGSQTGDRDWKSLERPPTLAVDLDLLLEHGSLKSLEAPLGALRLSYPLIFNVADERRGLVYEASTRVSLRRDHDPEGTKGLLTATNTPLLPDWPPYRDNPAFYEDSVARRGNLVNLANAYKGAIDERVMMAILDTPQEAGGATPSVQDRDVWQHVCSPGERAFWFKAPGYMDWTYVNLGKYFDR